MFSVCKTRLKNNFCVVDDWYYQEIKIIKDINVMSSQEILFCGTEKECNKYINSLRSEIEKFLEEI